MGMVVICVCLALELSLVGAVDGRLSWPYGDLVPGNYLAKELAPFCGRGRISIFIFN